jgi:hypothetical protein
MSDRSKWSAARAAYQRHLDDIAGLALRTGPDLYPSVTLARESLGWIEAQSFAVLGFDGFTTDGEWLIPSLEHIADFSRLLDNRTDWDACVRKSIEESRRVVRLPSRS